MTTTPATAATLTAFFVAGHVMKDGHVLKCAHKHTTREAARKCASRGGYTAIIAVPKAV